MDQEKIFVGSGKSYGQYGNVGINICVSDIPKEYIKESKNGKKYLRLNVCKMKSTDKFGNDFYLEVNTWKPEQKAVTTQINASDFIKGDDEIPF